jgi:hypothetical protein
MIFGSGEGEFGEMAPPLLRTLDALHTASLSISEFQFVSFVS